MQFSNSNRTVSSFRQILFVAAERENFLKKSRRREEEEEEEEEEEDIRVHFDVEADGFKGE